MIEEDKTFRDVLIKLGIQDYEERIFNSNSHGELRHIFDYYMIANSFPNLEWFREWFILVVESAKKNWERPQSVYQHIGRILQDHINELETE